MDMNSLAFLALTPQPLPTANPNTYWVSNPLTASELASLRQDQKEASVYLQKAFQSARPMSLAL
jgi:hypothetical protein